MAIDAVQMLSGPTGLMLDAVEAACGVSGLRTCPQTAGGGASVAGWGSVATLDDLGLAVSGSITRVKIPGVGCLGALGWP